MGKLRITIFSEKFWPEGGGSALATYLIAKYILSKFFYVSIVSGTKRPSIDILRRCRYVLWESSLKPKYKPLKWIRLLINSNKLKKLISNADIVYITSHTLLPLALVVKKLKPKVKVILHLHNYQPITYTSVLLKDSRASFKNDIIVERFENNSTLRTVGCGFTRSLNLINTLSLYFADRIICVSKRQAKILKDNLKDVKIEIIYNPVPGAQIEDYKKTKIPSFSYSGGSSFIKGFPIIAKLIAYFLMEENYRVKFRLLGTYDLYSRKIFRIFNRVSKGSVEVLGFQMHKKTLKIYAESWAIIFPTICEEPLPYTVMESLLTGTIPIASNIGGIPEIVGGSRAEEFLCNPGDIDCFVSKINEVINLSLSDMENIRHKLREGVIKRFGINQAEKLLIKVFNEVATSAGTA